MVTLPIHQVANVRVGLTLRGREVPRPERAPACRLVRIGDIDDDGRLTQSELVAFSPATSVKAVHFLQRGDILFPNRGTRNVAAVFDREETNALAGSQFLILRPDPRQLVPAYLAWYLSSPAAAAHLNEFRCGSVVLTLPSGALESLVMPLPTLAKQTAIAALHALSLREQALQAEISRLRAAVVQQQLLSIVTTP
jgi:hypothetical protein